MKRIIALLLCLALCLGSLTALADVKYSSQPEKLALQFINGSGVKGSLTFSAEGEADWAKTVASISGVEMQLRALDEVTGGYQVRLYVSNEGETTALTELYSDSGKNAWLQSDFLMGKTYAFSANQNLLTGLTSIGKENPSWYSVLMRMLLQVNDESWRESWEPKLQDAYQQIDLWLTPYASAPEMLEVNGEKRMLIRYEIPAAAIKQQMKALLPVLLGNQGLSKQMSSLMTNEQATIYLHEGYSWYYNQIIDALPLEGNAVLERQFSTLGVDYSTLITLPVANSSKGLKEITLTQEAGNTMLSLIFDTKTILLTAVSDGKDTVMGTLRVYDEQQSNLAVGYELNHTLETSEDEKGRAHETYHWTLNVQPELSFLANDDPVRKAYKDFDPFTVDVNAHFYSKSGDATAVTLELDAKVVAAGSTAAVSALIKSASPWHLPDAYTGETVSLQTMTAEQRAELWQDWLNNAIQAIAALRPVEEPVEEESAGEAEVVVEEEMIDDEPAEQAATITDLTEE